jgi:hypothetical protein
MSKMAVFDRSSAPAGAGLATVGAGAAGGVVAAGFGAAVGGAVVGCAAGAVVAAGFGAVVAAGAAVGCAGAPVHATKNSATETSPTRRRSVVSGIERHNLMYVPLVMQRHCRAGTPLQTRPATGHACVCVGQPIVCPENYLLSQAQSAMQHAHFRL